MAHKFRMVIKYQIVETREFEFEHENPHLGTWDAFDSCEDVLGFDKGKVIDREVIRGYPYSMEKA